MMAFSFRKVFFWRVSAIDKDNNEGDFSEFGRFSVTKLTNSTAPPRG